MKSIYYAPAIRVRGGFGTIASKEAATANETHTETGTDTNAGNTLSQTAAE
jgi:hypothetical protein